MSKATENMEDVKFVVAAVEYNRGRTIEEYRSDLKKDPLHSFSKITDEKGIVLVIGHAARLRIFKLSERYLISEKMTKKVELSSFANQVGNEIAQTFCSSNDEPTSPKIMKMMARALKKTVIDFKEITHFIPCVMFLTNDNLPIEIGPVKFWSDDEFWSLHEDKIKNDLERNALNAREERQKIADSGYDREVPGESVYLKDASRTMRGLKAFFGQYNWIAEITIAECSEPVSRRRALLAVRGALNVLKLMVGREYADRLRTAEDLGQATHSFELEQIVDGPYLITSRFSVNGNSVGDEWRSLLTDNEGIHFRAAEKVLDLAIRFENAPPLCERFLGALSWYGDGVSEPSAGARIVKFVSAIESLVGTGNEKSADGKSGRGVTDIVTERASIFYSRAAELPFEDVHSKITKIYDFRSKLVHGSISPFDKSHDRIAIETEKVARMILLASLDYFESIGWEDQRFNAKGMKIQFGKFEKDFRDNPTP